MLPSPSPSPLKVLLLTGLLCLIWGSTWIVIQGGLQSLPPFTSAALRFGLAALCMTGLAALLAEREGGSRPTPRLTLSMGTLNFGLSYGLVYWSETRLPSSLVSVLWAVFPMLQAVMGHLFLPGERVNRLQTLGFGLGFLGVAALFATDLAGIGPGAIPAGALLLLSPLASAFGTTYVKKHGQGTSSLRLNRNGMWVGAAMLACAALATEREAVMTWNRGAWLSILYLALIGTVVSFGTYFWLLRHTPANRLSVIAYVTPGIALTLGVILKDEPVTAFTLVGLGSILAGVFLVHWSGGKAPQRAGASAASS